MAQNLTRQRTANPEGDGGELLSYAIFFRVRLLICLFLFLCFLYAERNVLPEEKKEQFYQMLEKNMSVDDWIHPVRDAFFP